jgi:hypothetical protein
MTKPIKKVLAIVGLTLLAAIGILGMFGVAGADWGVLPIHWTLILGLLVLASVLFIAGLYLLWFVYRFVTKPQEKSVRPVPE